MVNDYIKVIAAALTGVLRTPLETADVDVTSDELNDSSPATRAESRDSGRMTFVIRYRSHSVKNSYPVFGGSTANVNFMWTCQVVYSLVFRSNEKISQSTQFIAVVDGVLRSKAVYPSLGITAFNVTGYALNHGSIRSGRSGAANELTIPLVVDCKVPNTYGVPA